MSNTTQYSETLLNPVSFDPLFLEKRKYWIKVRSGGWKISETAKKALNDSIVILAGGDNNGNVVINTPDAPKIPENGTDGTYYGRGENKPLNRLYGNN